MSVAHADTHWGFDDVSVDRLYTVEQAAALLGIGRTKVYELVSSGRLPSRDDWAESAHTAIGAAGLHQLTRTSE